MLGQRVLCVVANHGEICLCTVLCLNKIIIEHGKRAFSVIVIRVDGGKGFVDIVFAAE
ncbi:hypothetical protein SDC9_131110 [bioreactor metagenome]|uniref:Uncharacterized protein n=1 Tax=bioreactor metagenome TaxID=1076179 RepID=A0A645D4B0_9ZZZZ